MSEQYQGDQRGRGDRVSFGEVLSSVEAPGRPVPGPYTLEPPDRLSIADPLSPRALDRRQGSPRRLSRHAKIGVVLGAMMAGAMLGAIPTRPVDAAPAGAMTDAEIVAEGVSIATLAAPVAEASAVAPQVIRLAPIEIEVVPSELDERGRVEHRQTESERQNAVNARYTGAVAASPAPRSTRPAGAPIYSGKPSEAEEAPARDLPAAPARDDVQGALEAVAPDARACAPQHRGAVVPVTVTFAASGRVTTALVEGTLAGSPEGSCVARTLRRARVAEFAGDRFVVAYPLRL